MIGKYLRRGKRFCSGWWRYLRSIRQGRFESRYNLRPVPPCYYVVDRLTSSSVMVDLGTGNDADVSQYLISEYGLRSYGFDPTRKHHPDLGAVVRKTQGRFQYYPYAISGVSGIRKFFESQDNISGSFSTDHVNIKQDTTISYDVEVISLAQMFDLLGLERIDLMKMDIEGEEYSVLNTAMAGLVDRVGQLIVEFHHDNIGHVSRSETNRMVARLKKSGFKSYTTDNINYLFFRV